MWLRSTVRLRDQERVRLAENALGAGTRVGNATRPRNGFRGRGFALRSYGQVATNSNATVEVPAEGSSRLADMPSPEMV